MSEKAHAILAPSAADRWMTCLGSTALTKDLPNVENAYSTEGTDYHELAAVCLEADEAAGESTNALDYVGQALPSGALVTEENARYLQEGYIVHVQAYAALGTLVVEKPLPLSWYTGNAADTGTGDAIIHGVGRELIVADLKFGRGVEVSPDDNRQCKIYAISAIEEQELWEEYDTVRLVILQPRTGDGKPKEWVISIEDLKKFKAEVINTSLKIAHDQPGSKMRKYIGQLPLIPSEKACRFCKAKATCPALLNFVEGALTEGFVDETTQQPAMAHDEGAIRADGDALGAAMNKVDLVEIWMKAVRAAVEVELLAGRSVQGWKLVQGKKGNRKWSDEEEATELLKSFRLKMEEMYDMTLITPPSAEKLLAKTFPRRWVKVKKLVTQSEGSAHVAPESDKRPALVVGKPEEGFIDDGSDLI